MFSEGSKSEHIEKLDLYSMQTREVVLYFSARVMDGGSTNKVTSKIPIVLLKKNQGALTSGISSSVDEDYQVSFPLELEIIHIARAYFFHKQGGFSWRFE
jgi:hypothetical protein